MTFKRYEFDSIVICGYMYLNSPYCRTPGYKHLSVLTPAFYPT